MRCPVLTELLPRPGLRSGDVLTFKLDQWNTDGQPRFGQPDPFPGYNPMLDLAFRSQVLPFCAGCVQSSGADPRLWCD